MKYKLIIFDLDGTVLDTLDDLMNSVNYALRKNSLPERSREEVRTFVGNGIRLLIERAVPGGTVIGITDKVFADFKEHYAVHSCDNTRPYEGINELLTVLNEKGIKTAVVSNKADFAVQTLSERYFAGLFAVSVGERENIARKPAPDSVNAVIEMLGGDKKSSVYVGDSEVDIETALNAGIPCISVDWGFRSRALLQEKGAATIVSSADELLHVLSD